MDAEHVQGLIEVLLNPSADIGIRDDAAMDLYAMCDPGARAALFTVASEASTPYIVLASAGESLGQIAVATGRPLSESERAQLAPDARREYDIFHETARATVAPDGAGNNGKATKSDVATPSALAQVSARTSREWHQLSGPVRTCR
ncbi:hypothetical protein [Streptomyces sp. NBC_00151]|uniref:hypothetical protein n=1 Tax=Streptomyces sp. NBC_00151 TaxID=2975669 RepID=UPI002DD87B2A|nr:hypothetical protein [Streptomyces sp. NBC_00151]WRZ44627.1 hypothetical protein OG915_45540 [Streptomyces sp. NBC_00151]